MAEQSLDQDEQLNVRWAFDDPNPKANKRIEEERQQQFVEHLLQKGPTVAQRFLPPELLNAPSGANAMPETAPAVPPGLDPSADPNASYYYPDPAAATTSSSAAAYPDTPAQTYASYDWSQSGAVPNSGAGPWWESMPQPSADAVNASAGVAQSLSTASSMPYGAAFYAVATDATEPAAKRSKVGDADSATDVDPATMAHYQAAYADYYNYNSAYAAYSQYANMDPSAPQPATASAKAPVRTAPAVEEEDEEEDEKSGTIGPSLPGAEPKRKKKRAPEPVVAAEEDPAMLAQQAALEEQRRLEESMRAQASLDALLDSIDSQKAASS